MNYTITADRSATKGWAVFVTSDTEVIARWRTYSRTIPANTRIEFLSRFPDEAAARRACRQVEVY